MRKTKIEKNKFLLEFDDILDYVAYAEAGPEDGHSRVNTPERNKFSGGTWEDAVKQATTGNPELVKNFFDGVNVLTAMISEEKVGEIRDVTGEYFDVSDFLSGEPEVFRRDDYSDHRQVVPVYASFSMSCDIKNDIIRNRGCGIIALCDELCKSGFIVDLHLVHAVRGRVWDNFEGTYYTKIKVGLDPLDLDTAAFIIANPLCLRRLFFAELENVTEMEKCGYYGSPEEYDLSEIFDSWLSGFYFTSSSHSAFRRSNYGSLDAAKGHIMNMIEEFKNNAEQVILG